MTKEYRTFHGRPNVKIKKRFDIFKWGEPYYSMYELYAFSLGGQVTYSYHYVMSAKNVFGFRKWLKDEKYIKNLVAEKRQRQEWQNNMPEWFKTLIRRHNEGQ